MITLRKLKPEDQKVFEIAFSNFPKENNFEFVSAKNCDARSFAQFLKETQEMEQGLNLAPGFVPSTTLFGFDSEGQIVGRISIRHILNDYLLNIGGHVGYGVVPQFRRQGIASQMLKLSLLYCSEKLKLNKVLLTCDDENLGSIKTIEKNGGVLENIVGQPPKRRYWITLER